MKPSPCIVTQSTTPHPMLNFAYGSNMLTARIRERVPSARALGVATLRGHQLRWHKASKDGSGKCDVFAASDIDCVSGVLYELSLSDKDALDRAEGLGRGYSERRVDVNFMGDTVAASVYYATAVDPMLKPYTWYKELVVAGARQHGLPPEYIHALQGAGAMDDANLARHAKNMALLQLTAQTL
ncbi:gamma-glutamylcyclotransferase family protein [Cupriavidus basilensis]